MCAWNQINPETVQKPQTLDKKSSSREERETSLPKAWSPMERYNGSWYPGIEGIKSKEKVPTCPHLCLCRSEICVPPLRDLGTKRDPPHQHLHASSLTAPMSFASLLPHVSGFGHVNQAKGLTSMMDATDDALPNNDSAYNLQTVSWCKIQTHSINTTLQV